MDEEYLCAEGFTVPIKRIILIMLALALLIGGCSPKSDEGLFYDIQKKINSMDRYSCEVEIIVQGKESKQAYRVKQWFQKPNRYRLEVISPESLRGKTVISDGLRAWIAHPQIEQEWIIRDFQNSEEQNLFLGYFVKNCLNSEAVTLYQEERNQKRYLVLESEIPGNHVYYHKEKLWMDLETQKPSLLQVFDAQGNLKMEVKYDKFQYNPDLEDDFFKIPEKG